MPDLNAGATTTMVWTWCITRQFENRCVFLSPGQLGYGDSNNRGDEPGEMGDNLPDVDLGDDFVVDIVSLGYYHSCALSITHAIKCWGIGWNGRLGIGDADETHLGDDPGEMGSDLQPLEFGNSFIPVQLSAGGSTSCAVSANHKCRCWGGGERGLTGQGNTDDVYVPTTVLLGGTFDAAFVSVGYKSACALSTIGGLKVCDFSNASSCLTVHCFLVFVSVGVLTIVASLVMDTVMT